ncbi:sugar ABC transporter ATP-binding protein [Roseiarcus sp.]|uniref:sugar ABC transporter ATP-binding protein n=1 Tax=Roseiarcus sp. TaxID=1969460 RepID=UPI003F9C2BC4
MTDQPLALEMLNIVKTFPGVRALDDVSFGCARGEVHALCGENGAGKSTLIKVLGGIYPPDAGRIRLDGRDVSFSHPVAARRAGISIIHQELSLLPYRTVAENIYLGLEPSRFGALDRRKMRTDSARLLDRLGSAIAPDVAAGDLSIAHQQIVEIAKALALDAKILVMDEPTAALDGADASRLLDLVRRLSRQGVTIVYISHHLSEIQAVADRVTVLKDGRTVLTAPLAEAPTGRLVRAMVGRDLSDFYPPRSTVAPGSPTLVIRGGTNGRLRGVDLAVRAGEIVGVAGLEGSGKSALGRAIAGDEPFESGTMEIAGKVVAFSNPRSALEAGLGRVAEDRKRESLLMQQSVRDNAALSQRAFANLLRSPNAAPMSTAATDERLKQVDVRAANFDQEIRQLSGGNQQRVIIARLLALDPQVLVFSEPTRGVDVAAKAAIYRIMRDLAGRGRGILMISSDLPEIVGVSDRIVVMREGGVAGELPGGAGEEDVMALAVGHDDRAPQMRAQ